MKKLLVLAMLLGCGCAEKILPPQPAPQVMVSGAINVEDVALRRWRFLFAASTGLEFAVCLYGKVQPDGILIERDEVADVVYADSASITFHCEKKDPEFLGSLHSHLVWNGERACWVSVDDARLLKSHKLVMVICGIDGEKMSFAFMMPGDSTYKTAEVVVPRRLNE